MHTCDSCANVGFSACQGDLFRYYFHCPKFERINDFDHPACDEYKSKESDEPSSNRKYQEWFYADTNVDYDRFCKGILVELCQTCGRKLNEYELCEYCQTEGDNNGND